MFARIPQREAHPGHRGAAGCRATAPPRRHPGRGHLHLAGIRGHHAGRLGGERDPARRAADRPGAARRRDLRGGMAGWQITLIALGAALVAATAAVFLDRALAARRAASATTA